MEIANKCRSIYRRTAASMYGGITTMTVGGVVSGEAAIASWNNSHNIDAIQTSIGAGSLLGGAALTLAGYAYSRKNVDYINSNMGTFDSYYPKIASKYMQGFFDSLMKEAEVTTRERVCLKECPFISKCLKEAKTANPEFNLTAICEPADLYMAAEETDGLAGKYVDKAADGMFGCIDGPETIRLPGKFRQSKICTSSKLEFDRQLDEMIGRPIIDTPIDFPKQ